MRVLADACTFCGSSLVLCDCIRFIDSMPCCEHCVGITSHRTSPADPTTPDH